MAKYDDTNRGVLFKNKDKREGKQDPDYRGEININGVAFFLSAWINTARESGEKYMSLGVQKKEKQPDTPRGVPPQDLNDDIPF